MDNKNTVNTSVVISKNFKKDTKSTLLMPNSSYGTHFIVDKKEPEKLEKSIPKDTKITLETLSTQLDNKDFFFITI